MIEALRTERSKGTFFLLLFFFKIIAKQKERPLASLNEGSNIWHHSF